MLFPFSNGCVFIYMPAEPAKNGAYCRFMRYRAKFDGDRFRAKSIVLKTFTMEKAVAANRDFDALVKELRKVSDRR